MSRSQGGHTRFTTGVAGQLGAPPVAAFNFARTSLATLYFKELQQWAVIFPEHLCHLNCR